MLSNINVLCDDSIPSPHGFLEKYASGEDRKSIFVVNIDEAQPRCRDEILEKAVRPEKVENEREMF